MQVLARPFELGLYACGWPCEKPHCNDAPVGFPLVLSGARVPAADGYPGPGDS
jgi:hypothetical protein